MFKDNIPHQKLVLDINQTNSFETLEMKQGDRGSRFIDITLVANGVQLQFPKSEDEINDRPDKYVSRFAASNSGTLLQNEAFSFNADNTITIEVNENALSLAGILDCEVVVYDADYNKLTSATFNIRVGKSSAGGNPVVVDALEKSVEEKHLADDAVSTRAIAEESVTGSKLAKKAIASYHIGEQEVYPEHLRYNYLRLEKLDFAGATHHILTAQADELKSPFETVYHIVSRGTGDIAAIGVGRCVGRFISISETGSVFAVRNLNTDKMYHINFTPEEITSITEATDNVIDTAINNKLAVFDLEEVMAFNHFISKSLIKGRVYRFTLGAGLKDKAGVGPFLGTYIENDYNNDGVVDPNIGENRIVKCMDLSSGIHWNIDLDNETITEDTSYLNKDYQQLRHVSLSEITYDELWNKVKEFGGIKFNTRGSAFSGSTSAFDLPSGDYVAYYSSGYDKACCWNINNGKLYTIQGLDRFDTGVLYYSVASPVDELYNNYVYLSQNSAERVVISKTSSSATGINLIHNYEHRFTAEAVTFLSLTLPEEISENFECSVIFASGETATTFSCPSCIKWSGDDVASVTSTENDTEVTYNCLVPQIKKTYNIIFWYDGFNVNAVSRGVENG